MISKKAFMKTFEVFIAVMITFTFVVVFLPRDVPFANDQSIYLLKNLERNEPFRNCVIAKNYNCINQTIDVLFQGRFFYYTSIFKSVEPELDTELVKIFSENNVRVYEWFFAGNQTEYNPTILKLYYWIEKPKS